MHNCTDLRLWIEEAEKLGEVRHVEDAHWVHEMGAITELASQMDPMPAVLFDKIQEYPAGYRVLTNALASVSRVALTFGMPTDLSNLEFVKEWRKRAGSFKPIRPVTVKDGPVLENVKEGKDVNLLEFPPRSGTSTMGADTSVPETWSSPVIRKRIGSISAPIE